VPILEAWDGEPPTVFKKPVNERVAFRFAQDSVSASLPDDVCREVLLKNMEAFAEWLQQQLSLQNWRKQEGVNLPNKAAKERERYAKKKSERLQKERMDGEEGDQREYAPNSSGQKRGSPT
jgi:hypothetical protein